MPSRGLNIIACAAALSMLILLTGCKKSEPPLPNTHQVRGKVAYSDGQHFTGGMIEFFSVDDPQLTIRGIIQSDGTFELETSSSGTKKASGAVEGKYKVSIIPPLPAGGQDEVQPVVEQVRLEKLYVIEPNDDNELNIIVPR